MSRELENLEGVKELIDSIADCYDLPSDEETEEMNFLTGINWSAEDLQEACCEYWSHNSLEETAYFMFHESYPPTNEVKMAFWKYKPNVVLNDKEVYEKYRFGKGTVKALEPLPLEEILEKLREEFPNWEDEDAEGEKSWLFCSPNQKEYWTDTGFNIFEYGRETAIQREHQILVFECHNMSKEEMSKIFQCMESFQCPLHICEEKNF